MDTQDQVTYKNPVKQLGWAKIEHILTFDPTLSDGAYRTYAMLIYHAQQNEETTVSLNTVADERDLRRETISAHIKELEEHKLIHRIEREGTSSITEIEELPKVYEDMAAVVLHARQERHREYLLEKSTYEKNLTGVLEKSNRGCAKNLTQVISKEQPKESLSKGAPEKVESVEEIPPRQKALDVLEKAFFQYGGTLNNSFIEKFYLAFEKNPDHPKERLEYALKRLNETRSFWKAIDGYREYDPYPKQTYPARPAPFAKPPPDPNRGIVTEEKRAALLREHLRLKAESRARANAP